MTATMNRTERLALLLNLLGDDASTLARANLEGEALASLEQALKDFDEVPPSREEIDVVLGDFEESSLHNF